MRRGWAASIVVLALAMSGCGGDGDDAADEPERSGLETDAEALVACLGAADVEAKVKDSVAWGVEDDHVGVEASDLPTELLKYNSGSGTLSGVSLWTFESAEAAEAARTAITLQTEDDENSWVDGRVVVDWYYPVDRTQPQAVSVDDCVAELNG